VLAEGYRMYVGEVVRRLIKESESSGVIMLDVADTK
jgi:hypothetical protein